MRKLFGAISVVVGAAFLWLGYAALQAQRNEVSLDVRNENVRAVVRKIERQTWETILVAPEVQGRITLRVQKAPLEAVLAIIAEQTSSQWSALYPLYSGKASLENFKKTVLGQIPANESRWTNFVEAITARGDQPSLRYGLAGAPPTLFDANLRTQNRLISVHMDQKPLDFATASLSRFGQVQIVPEDGTRAIVTLKLADSTMNGAVRQLARQANRQWDKLYALVENSRGQAVSAATESLAPTDFINRPAALRPTNHWSLVPEIRDVLEKQLQIQGDSPAAESAALPPEQPDDPARQAASQIDMKRRFEQRIMSAIKNTSPLQRLEWDRAMAEYRKNKEKQESK